MPRTCNGASCSTNRLIRVLVAATGCMVGCIGCGQKLQPPVEGDSPEIIALKKMGARIEFATMNLSPDAPRTVNLSGTNVTDQDLKLLEKVNVVDLNLQETGITDAGLDTIAGLKTLNGSLNLVGTKLTNAGVAKLTGMKKINNLSLGRTAINDDGLKHLQGLTNLEVLDLHKTAVTDAGIEQLAGLKNMAILSLGGTEVTSAGALKFKQSVPRVQIFGVRLPPP